MNGVSLEHPPLVSIIIPTLQEEKALPQTLAQFTALLRKKHNLELVVSDGGSTDGTIATARAMADIVVEHHSPCRQIIAMGRNQGARAAKGDIFIFLNADVLIEEPDTFLSLMIDEALRLEISAATCNVNIYPEVERVADWIFHNFFNGYFWLLNRIGMGMGRGECQVMRREIFEKAGGYDERLAAGEDFDLFLRLHKLGKIRFVRELTVFESPRRFGHFGYLHISLLWFINALSVLFFKRSYAKEWKPIR